MVIIISITQAKDGTFMVVWSDNGKQYKAYLFNAYHIQQLKDCTNDTCKRAALNNGINKIAL